MGQVLCKDCQRLKDENSQLRTQLENALRLLDEERRKGKRQAAPFSKGAPKLNPKKPGRKAGADYGVKAHREPPEQIDEVYEAPLPEQCPECGGAVEHTDVAHQYQVEIPRRPIHRQFNIHIGHCQDCHRRVQGRHPLQTSDALGAAASQLGPDAQAAVVECNKQAGMSHGKVRRFFKTLFGISLSRGGSTHVVLRSARRSEPIYTAICDAVRESPWVVPDETGWRVGGRNAWLHGFVGQNATAYIIDPTRSGEPARGLLGADYVGLMIHDGWSPYDGFTNAIHQQCLGHLVRRAREMLETATSAAARFPRRIRDLLQHGLKLRDRHEAGDLSAHGLAVCRGRLDNDIFKAIYGTKTNPDNERFARHLRKHWRHLLTFLKHPGLDATNWRAEHAMRFAVILRKVWGGSRTWAGAWAQSALMSVWRTCWQREHNPVNFLSRLLRHGAALVPLPP